MLTLHETELQNLLRNVDKFVHNVGLTYTKPIEMNKYLDFKTNGKANPNEYYDKVLGTFRIANIQTGFEYNEQLIRKWKAEGIEIPTEREDKKSIWYSLESVALAKHKTKDEYYFRYQDHDSSYISIDYTFLGNPIEKAMFERYMKDTSTDYSKYQENLQNTLRIKVLSLKYINRIVIHKQEYQIIH
ncbi:MAG: hypothetical protein ACO3E1_12670 [Flavobacteriales bacterium]